MKIKFFLFFIFFCLILIPISYAECSKYVEVYLTLESHDANKKISEYQFPEFRERDLFMPF